MRLFKIKSLKLLLGGGRSNRVLSYYKALSDDKCNIEQRITNFFRIALNSGIHFKRLNVDILKAVMRTEKENLILSLIDSKVQELKVYELLDLSSLMIGFGYFETALKMRKKAVKVALSFEKSFLKRYIFTAMILCAALEDRNEILIKRALRRIDTFKRVGFKNPYYRKLHDYFFDNKILSKNAVDKKYHNLLRGKSIAIIGPLELAVENVKEIPSFDFIATMNIADFSSDRFKILKPDIIYNDNSISKKLCDNYGGKLPSSVEAYIARNKIYNNKVHGTEIIRSIHGTNEFTMNGGINMIQRMLIDMLQFEPAKIKVFGADLYTTSNYSTEYEGGMGNHIRHFVHHDLISNFYFTKYLNNFPEIEYEDRLQKAVDLSINEYFETIKRNYFGRK